MEFMPTSGALTFLHPTRPTSRELSLVQRPRIPKPGLSATGRLAGDSSRSSPGYVKQVAGPNVTDLDFSRGCWAIAATGLLELHLV
eukprot:s385_g26.t1